MQRVMAVTKLGEDLELVKCELPVPKGDEVLIRTTFAGLCHSDLHQIDGYFDLGGDEKLNVGARKKLPFCVGHEIEGEVIAVGKNAKGKVNIGQSYGIYVSSKIQNLKQRYSL
jgi:D-arabinose 1-dehydrogenase-like Zn-dependent alcohol dehydrogenase|tara:strand:- start:1103 stop:1441 length:339 start_codon:yes stop_codon:yes gene_type:complete